MIGALFGLGSGAAEVEPWVTLPTPYVANEQTTFTTINFGGHQWIVVGTPSAGKDGEGSNATGGNGIKSPDGTLTLLLKNGDSGFGTTRYRQRRNTEAENFSYYKEGNNDFYYADNPAGSDPWSTPSEYRGSSPQQMMETAATNLSSKEQSVIAARTLTADDDTTHPIDQMFWALSYDEWHQLTSTDARKWLSEWWLRSPSTGSAAYTSNSNGTSVGSAHIYDRSPALRPALNLKLEPILFASLATAGKSTATVGGSWSTDVALTSAPSDGGAIKYTFLNESIETPELTLKKNLEFDFANASNGPIIAGLIYDPDTDNNAYAKLTDTPAEEGSFTLPNATKIANGTYTLHLYGEEANGDLYSDFAGKPVSFEAEVDSGAITYLSLLTTDVPFGLDGGEVGLADGKNYTEKWTLGTNDGTLSVKSNETAEISGEVTGTGGLTKIGAGKLVLDASGNSVGTVDINEGSLIVGGTNNGATLTATTITAANALLGGHGTIAGDVSIQSGGILSPGDSNSIGTLPIEGNMSFDPGALYAVEIDFATDTADLTAVNDTARLAGTVVVQNLGRLRAGEWKILEATTIDGTDDEFDAVTFGIDRIFLKPYLFYTPTTAYVGIRNAFGDYARTRNERATAGALETLDPGSALYDELVSLSGGSGDEARRILDALSGEPHVSLKNHLARQDDGFMRRFLRHVGQSAQRGTASGRGDDFWINVDRTHADADGNAARTTLHGTEISGGHDARLPDGGLAGVAFRIGESRQDVKNDRNATADITTGTAAFYVGKERFLSDGTLRVLLSGALSRHEVESKRSVHIGSNTQKLETTTAGTAFVGALETAYGFSLTESFIVEPYAALTLTHLRMDGFKEKGGSAALKKKSDTWTPVTSTLGVRFSTLFPNHVTLDADLGWQHRYGSAATPKSVFTFTAGSAPFEIRGADLNRNAAILGLGLGVNITDNARLSLRYDGELSTRGKSHQGQVVFEIKW